MRYLQLVHNVYDPATKTGKTKVLHSFGRVQDVDRAAIERLIDSLQRALNGLGGSTTTSAASGVGLELLGTRLLGPTWALDGLWHQLDIHTTITKIATTAAGTRRDATGAARLERVLFALVAARAIDPASKLATAAWLSRRTWIPGLTDTVVHHTSAATSDEPGTGDDADTGSALVSDDECYRAMDFLHHNAPAVEEAVFWGVSTLLDLEVDLLFFDTTSTYFELDEADEPVLRDDRGQRLPDPDDGPGIDGGIDGPVDEPSDQPSDQQPDQQPDQQDTREPEGRRVGFRTWGKSKNSRGDLPQIVIGMAVTRAGIPVRVWSWPGNTADSALIRQAKADIREWTLARIVWVGDRGFTSAANRADLRRGGNTYILGEKIRTSNDLAMQALARPGRYQVVTDNLQVKEMNIAEDERFVVCFNPEQAVRDAAIRDTMVAKLTALIEGADALSEGKRGELTGRISMMPGPRRYLRHTERGLLRIDKRKVTEEPKLDGKYLLRCSDAPMSAADIALGYRQLIQVERGWRDLKTHLELRPVYHRREDRIRAHVLLCWLTLLLVRIVEVKTGRSWGGVREDLADLGAVVAAGPAGVFVQSTTPTRGARGALAALDVAAPKQILALATPVSPATGEGVGAVASV